VLPAGLTATLDRGSWSPPPVFEVIGRLGGVPTSDREATFNLGIGLVLVVDEPAAASLQALLIGRAVPTWRVGTVHADGPGSPEGGPGSPSDLVRGTKGVDGGGVRLVGSHPRQ
jgi:phosphoribosylformylglycinamidine cyclo-ligase